MGEKLLDVFGKRRSVRAYKPVPIEKEKIDICIESARLSPSACNSQPWHFIIIDDPDLKNRVCEAAFSGAYSMNSFVKEAPVIAAIVCERKMFLSVVGKYVRGVDYCFTDIGIAGEHFCLQASQLGLGTCWIGWFNEKGVKKTLNIPASKKVGYLISLGYPSDQPVEKVRKLTSEMSSRNRYG